MKYLQINGTTLEKVFYIPLFIKVDSIIPDTITIIGKNAFAGVSSVSHIIIPPSVQIIESGAFHNCEKLQSIIIPDTVKKVEDGAFANCFSLKRVQYSPQTAFGNRCFSGCKSLEYISDGEIDARTFYYPALNQFAISIKQNDLSTEEYTIYKGRFADEFFPQSKLDFEAPVLYYAEITKNNNKYVWYDTLLDRAILGAQYQASGQSYVNFFHKEWTPESKITPNEFSLLTGICFEGLDLWLKVQKNGTRDSEWDLLDVLRWLHNAVPKVYERTIYALEHQYEPACIKFFSDGVSRSDLLESK